MAGVLRYCSPTRSSFLSARFPLHVNEKNGGTCDSGGIDLRMKLLPEKLRSAGFRSYMLGKGHIGARSDANLPVNRGLCVSLVCLFTCPPACCGRDGWLTMIAAAASCSDHHLGFLGGGEDHYTQRVKAGVDLWNDHAPAYGMNGTYSCYLYSDRAVALIEDHAQNFADKGMFMYVLPSPYSIVGSPRCLP